MAGQTCTFFYSLSIYVGTCVKCGINFCGAFISSILLFFKLAGCNLAQTLLNPPKVVWHWLFCKACLQVPKDGSSQNRVISM